MSILLLPHFVTTVQDGVTVAKSIEFKDRFMNMGAQAS